MNPRDFCRETGYTSAVALTYSFNPTFFENLVLPDLWHGGTGEIVVVADQRQLESGLQHSAGQLRYLGSSYHLTTGNRTAFHPKLLLRVGPSGAYLWLGSGNITHGGWGGNHELAVVWKLDGDDLVSRRIVAGLLDQIAGYCESTNAAEAIRRISDRSWIARAGADEPTSPVIVTSPNRTLCDQLALRWRDRRFTSLRVFTGSSDRNGRFIKWCHETFCIERCVVIVDPRTASFDPVALESLPIRVDIEPAPASPYLHAKLYWFEGPDGCAAIVGSANCSAAAWLVAPNYGGNVEAVCIYDSADAHQFSSILGRFPGRGIKPSDVPGLGKEQEKDDAGTDVVDFRLTELILHAPQGRLFARISRPTPLGARMSLRFRYETLALGESNGNQIEWDLPCPDQHGDGVTLFGQLIVEVDGQIYVSPPRWVDDQERLRQSARRGGFGRIASGLRHGRTSSERNAFLEELQLITKSLFSEPGAFPDPIPERNKLVTKGIAPPITPSDVLRQLADIETNSEFTTHHEEMPGFTLYGVMRELFGADEGEELTQFDSELSDDNESEGQTSIRAPDVLVNEPVEGKNPAPPTDRQKQRLKKSIETYLEQLSQQKFADKCSASQLVQAISLPLLISSAGGDCGWLDQRDAQQWVLLAIDRLFRVVDSQGGTHGLINIVRRRYESDGRLETFNQVVGDGTLWLALIHAISGIDWSTATGALERALTMQEVLRCGELLATAEVGRLAVLLPRLKSVFEGKTFLTRAVKVDRIMSEIESFLQKHFKTLTDKQVDEGHTEGDVVWRLQGWGSVRETSSPNKNVTVYWRSHGQVAKMKAAGFFVNVSNAARRYRDLKKLVDGLQEVFNAENSR